MAEPGAGDAPGIVVRAVEPDDHAAVRDLHAQPGAIAGTLQMPYPSLELWRERLAAQPASRHSLVAEADGQVVGMLGLWRESGSPRRRHAASLGMAVHDAWHGRGVGTALIRAALELADRWLDVRRIELQVFTDNARAIRLYERFDFQVEGTLRDYAFRDGRYVDAYLMARLAPR